MSQPNAWQTANRNRNSQSASRTPQNRSGNASPNPAASTQPPKQQENNRQPPSNPWTQRSSTPASASASNGPRLGDANAAPAVNNFNASAVKSFLARDAAPAVYKPQEAPDAGRASGSAWGAKKDQMANGTPFFPHLAKQVATTEGGG